VYQEEKIEREQRWEKIKDTSVEAIPKLRLRLPPGRYLRFWILVLTPK